ncbi:MAG TPA: hypothetical protein VFA26_09685, partial [Gemmataceae bacterium]|nr:hypothetical protein [Gemmataceae bacterium]
MKSKRLLWRIVALAGTAVLAGCGANGPTVEEPVVQPARPLGPVEQVSLADLLARPRPELAALCDEWAARARAQEKARRDGTLPFTLLPKARLPLVVPVFQEAAFSPKAGFSLPPYVAEDARDNELALHLARFGDAEAARRLADPASADTLRLIDACKSERNYPVEWTRLVALMLHGAEVRLASGDPEGRSELASLHGQLRKALDEKAARGPLGAVLLSRGRSLLGQAAGAWREAGKGDVAQQADADLAAWGDVPLPPLAVPAGASRAEVERLLRSRGQGRVVPALSTLRALDVFALPVPAEGAQAVVAAFGASEELAEVLVMYRPRIAEALPTPADLAHCL